jgi:hypothetical protein
MIAQLQTADHIGLKAERAGLASGGEDSGISPPTQGRIFMRTSVAAIAWLTAILSAVSPVPARAGGGATSAPSKYNNASQNQWHAQDTKYTITEFSSSSPKSAPKR